MDKLLRLLHPQSVPNITEASTNLYELIKGNNLVVYPDADIRLAVQRAVAVETSRGWKISKEKTSHKIDVVVALGMAALGAVQGGIVNPPMVVSKKLLEWARQPGLYTYRASERYGPKKIPVFFR